MLRRKKDNTVPLIQEMIANHDVDGLQEFLSRPIDEVSTQKLVIAATSVSEDTREVTLRLSKAEDKRGAVIEYLLSCASQPAPKKRRKQKKSTSEETKTAAVKEKKPQPHIATSEDVSILKAIADTQYQISQLSEQLNQLFQSVIPRMNEISADVSAIRHRVDTEVLPHIRCNTERLNLLCENQLEIARLITTDEPISDADLAKIASAEDITPLNY
tara:strand:+ start:1552 stop:2199 length:648 start_codon:yes stop_codon:yes gene_type:complete